MASINLRDIQRIARFDALINAKLDKMGDTKHIVVYERLDFRIQRGDRYIKKHYYNILYSKQYAFTTYIDEVERYQRLQRHYSSTSPFTIDVRIYNDKIDDMLIDYYNEKSKKYYDEIMSNNDYYNKRNMLSAERERVNPNNIQKYLNMIEFEL